MTGIATRFGVRAISLLARNYKALFGEPHSLTLRTSLKQARDLSKASAGDS